MLIKYIFVAASSKKSSPPYIKKASFILKNGTIAKGWLNYHFLDNWYDRGK